MIYIQSNKERTLPHHFDASCAMWGAIESGLDYRLTSFEEIMEKPMIWNSMIIKTNLFVGSVEFMREVFKRIGLNDVRVPMNSNRPHETLTLGEVKKRVATGEKLFIKPFQIKLFTGFVLDQCKYTCLNNIPDDTKIMVYEPFTEKIISEWRLYIHNHNIIDARNYSGDFKVQPKFLFAENHILYNKFGGEIYGTPNPKNPFPCGYAIDIGIFKSGQNVIIEYNDGWSLGSYGIENSLYLRFLTDRYFEIVKQK